MCGINGILHKVNTKTSSAELVAKMNDKLRHRGPDDAGIYTDDNISLGHQRLAIIDLSSDGHQPYTAQDYVIVYNGELYNYKEIRAQLKEYPFKTKTDTEVILAAYITWGEKCLDLFNGMFAFAIWNKNNEELFIARDRVGIKPLYYSEQETCFIFSSEIRALLASNEVPRKLNKEVLPEYLQYQTVHAPNTIIENVNVLLPGHCITISKRETRSRVYWNPATKIDGAVAEKPESTIHSDISDNLRKAVERRMIADVPYGAFLSGGIDSSLIVGLMSEVATNPVDTFSITFDESEFTEAKYSNLVAKHFGTNHHEIELKPNDFIEELPNALKSMDHPGGDGPNSYIVSKVTKNAGITMALSGLGGDELFGGYSIFKQTYDLNAKSYLNRIPRNIRGIAGNLFSGLKGGVAGQKIEEILSLKSITPASIYPTYRKSLSNKQVNLLIGDKRAEKISLLADISDTNDLDIPTLSKVSLYEMHSYMQNTLLRDTDQMSMASALEVRVPFLDHELIEYVLSVPDKFKYPVSPKSLLTKSLKGLVPEEVINRPKMGFVLPWKDWLKNELRGFCESHISNIEKREIYEKGSVSKLWNSFMNNDPLATWSRVWHIIVLEEWMKENSIEL
jgi:asparagine synthase (glutamine-hydrolysing)